MYSGVGNIYLLPRIVPSSEALLVNVFGTVPLKDPVLSIKWCIEDVIGLLPSEVPHYF